MGIDFTWKNIELEDTAHWSYGGFNRFREKVAAEMMIDLRSMKGFGGEKEWKEADLTPFLSHSDCDGELSPEDCEKTASALEKILSSWEDDYDKREGMTLVKNMKECAKNNVPLEFV